MSGMITTGDTNLSTYGNRTIAIEVTGVCRQDIMRTSNYTVKVPYSRMSQTIQSINRLGGKVAGISLGNTEIEAAAPATHEAESEPPEDSQEDSQKRSGSRKNRHRK